LCYYTDAEYDQLFAKISKAAGYICRINPGSYKGVTQSKLDTFLDKLEDKGVKAMSSATTMKKMGAKDALVKIAALECGLSCTAAYYDMKQLEAGFPKTLATGDVRVLKQNRGSQGEGIWVCKLAEGEQKKISNGVCPPDVMLDLQEAVDNHKETKTLGEFMKFCQKYLDGENGQLVDQKFLPRIVEGEIRVLMIGDTPIELVHKKPAAGGISATMGSGAKYVKYPPNDKRFEALMSKFKSDLPKLMDALELKGKPLPLVWTTDFILGPKDEAGNDTYFVGEFNCSCVGITQQLSRAMEVGMAAVKACGGEPLAVLKEQPKEPFGKIHVLECEGGSDKSKNGHRLDTIPICNALIELVRRIVFSRILFTHACN